MAEFNDRSPEEVNATFRRLRALKASFGSKPNKEERTTAMIGAMIAEGFTTRARIVGASRKLDLNQSHVVIMLENRTGTDPQYHLWTFDDGQYRLIV